MTELSGIDLKAAHKFSSRHKALAVKAAQCGCFYCCSTYPIGEVVEWFEEFEDFRDKEPLPEEFWTAACPICGIDAVLPDSSGLPVTSTAFLKAMNATWFEG